MRMQREATEQIRQMNARAMPPPETTDGQEKAQKNRMQKTKQNEPKDNDTLILLFILFLLYSDSSDPVLTLALLYLLM